MNILKLFKKEKAPTYKNVQLRTIHPPQQLTQQQWFKEFNVSMMWDKKVIHLD
jgi:hypothetical protein